MGYASTAALDLAMERGEVQARAGASLAGMLQEHPDWFPRPQDHSADPDRQRARTRTIRRAAHARAGQDRRAAPGAGARLLAALARPARSSPRRTCRQRVSLRCARPSTHHEGRRLPHRGTAAWPRHATDAGGCRHPDWCLRPSMRRPRSWPRPRPRSSRKRDSPPQRKRIARPREICNGDAGARENTAPREQTTECLNTIPPQSKHRCLIVGGGPVGLALAAISAGAAPRVS